MRSSFWNGGPDAYQAGLRNHYEPLLRDLRSRLSECTDDAERNSCRAEIAEIEAEYKARLKATGRLLF